MITFTNAIAIWTPNYWTTGFERLITELLDLLIIWWQMISTNPAPGKSEKNVSLSLAVIARHKLLIRTYNFMYKWTYCKIAPTSLTAAFSTHKKPARKETWGEVEVHSSQTNKYCYLK